LLTLALFAMLGGKVDYLMYWCLFFAFMEALLILLVVILVSLISNTTISVITALTVYIGGYAAGGLQELPAIYSSTVLKTILKVYTWLFPNFTHFNLKSYVLYKQTMPMDYLWGSTCYGIIYSFVLILLASIIFQRKNLD
ncbi:MAG: hypothetical protein WCG27_02865, partial [Pseudomonadota bacterium]